MEIPTLPTKKRRLKHVLTTLALVTALAALPASAQTSSGETSSQPPMPPLWSLLEDADQDGMTDVDELVLGMDPFNPEDGLSDLDGDDIELAWEFAIGTNPAEADTDTDGWSDSEEYLLYGTDPLDLLSFPLGDTPASGVDTALESSIPEAEAALPEPTPPPSLFNGDFSNVGNITTWKNMLTSTEYQGHGLEWNAGTIDGWSAYVGSTVEVWDAGGEKFVELDGSPGNYGIKQPITNAKAGGYVLAWRESGRNSTRAGTDPYCMRVYYMNGTSEVKIAQSKEFTGFSKTQWADNAFGFQITPEQLATAGKNPIYVAFIPTGSLNTYGTLIDKVSLLPMNIEEVISDQIAGNEANKLPTAFYKGATNNPMYMATHSGVNARLIVKMNVAASVASKILAGARMVGSTQILGSVASVAPPGKTTLSFDAYAGHHTYEIVAGYDANSNSTLETEEVAIIFAKTPKTDSSGATVSTGLGNLDKIIIATQLGFDSGKSGAISNNIWGTDYAGDLISAFAHGSSSVSEGTTTSPHTIISKQPGLSHPVGAKWNSSFNAETHTVSFYNGSEAANDVNASYALSQVLESAIGTHLTTIRSASGSSWTYSGSYNFSVSRDLVVTEPEWIGINELGYAFGKVTFIGTMYVSSRWVAGGKIEVGSVVYSGQFDDIYDFSYWGGAKAREASLVQVGHATLASAPESNSGKVFFTRVVFSGTKSIGKEF